MDNDKPQQKDEENIGSFYMGRMRPPPEPKRVLPPGVLSIVAIAALGGIIWYAYPRGAERYTDMDVPVVKADNAPIKEAPADPGGMEVRHQDSTVFDPLEKKPGAEVEKLQPPPEQPLDKDAVIKSADAKSPLPASEAPKLDLQMKDAGNGTEKIVPVASSATLKNTAPAAPAVKPVAESKAPAKSTAKSVTKSAVADDSDDETDEVKEAPKAIPAKAAVVPGKTAVVAAPAKAVAPVSGEAYEVQLGSYRDMEGLKKDWSRLQKKFSSQLGKLTMRAVKASIAGKGTFYRLQAGTVSKDTAQGICTTIKSAKGVCILAKK